MQQARFDLTGGTCTSCSIGISHMARRIKGVDDVYVDRGSSEIVLTWDGNEETVEKITNFVAAIGYEATLKETTEVV